MTPVRILIADDHEIVREGARAIVERQPGWEICGEASTGRQAVSQAEKLQPDIVIMDIGMPELNGLDATRHIKRILPKAEVLIFTANETEEVVRQVFKAGARAYLLKDAVKAELILAIEAVMDGRSFFSPKVSRILQEDYVQALGRRDADDSYDLLTDREREILQMIAEGKTNKEVANTLNLSLYTVDTHRTHILQKLNLHSVPELILYAVRKGIIS